MADATHIDETDMPEQTGPQRTCVVTRETRARDDLLRFVAGPDGSVVPDVKAVLPGRGVWVAPRRTVVAQAIKRKAFARGLKRQVTLPDDLDGTIDRMLAESALGALGFARKAGECITGAGKVESAARSHSALALLHASDGAEDGLRKLGQWAFSGSEGYKRDIAILRPFTTAELSLALGTSHVIHAAIMQGGAGRNALARISRLVTYRDG